MSVLPADVRNELTRKHSYQNIALLGFDWFLIMGAVIITEYYFNPVLYLISILFIGGRMMGLWSLLHDANHYMVLPKNKKWNDFISEFLIARPIFKSLKAYRKDHKAHHKFLGTNNDPVRQLCRYNEFRFPMPKWKLYMIFLMDLLGINFLRYTIMDIVRAIKYSATKNILHQYSAVRLLYYLCGGLMIIYFGVWDIFLLYWLIPYATWFSFLFRLVIIADHYFANGSNQYLTRTVKLNWFEQVFMVPHNLNYHHEHHTFGNIPGYNLERLHKKMIQHANYRDSVCIANGYSSVVKELSY